MKQMIIELLFEAKNKIEYQKVSKLTLSQRISNAVAVEKINFAIRLLRGFNNIN